MNVWIVFPLGEQQTGFYQGWFPRLALLCSRPRVKVGSKSSRHHQGAPKDSNSLHNRLKSIAESREEWPLGGNLDAPWAMVEKLLCANCLQSLETEAAIAMIWQTSLFYKGLYWDLEKLRKVFQAPTGGLWRNWDLCWDEDWGVQVLPSELLQLSHAVSSQWRCCKGSLNIALDLFPRTFTTLRRMENHLFSWTSRFQWKDMKFFLPTLSVFYLGKSYFYWSVF